MRVATISACVYVAIGVAHSLIMSMHVRRLRVTRPDTPSLTLFELVIGGLVWPLFVAIFFSKRKQ